MIQYHIVLLLHSLFIFITYIFIIHPHNNHSWLHHINVVHFYQEQNLEQGTRNVEYSILLQQPSIFQIFLTGAALLFYSSIIYASRLEDKMLFFSLVFLWFDSFMLLLRWLLAILSFLLTGQRKFGTSFSHRKMSFISTVFVSLYHILLRMLMHGLAMPLNASYQVLF